MRDTLAAQTLSSLHVTLRSLAIRDASDSSAVIIRCLACTLPSYTHIHIHIQYPVLPIYGAAAAAAAVPTQTLIPDRHSLTSLSLPHQCMQRSITCCFCFTGRSQLIDQACPLRYSSKHGPKTQSDRLRPSKVCCLFRRTCKGPMGEIVRALISIFFAPPQAR